MSTSARRFIGLTAFDAAFLLLSAACAFLTYRMVHAPALVEIRELAEEADNQIAQKQQMNLALARLNRLRVDTGRLEHQLASFTETIFEGNDEQRYMESISDLQQNCRVAIEEITPGSPRYDEQSRIRPISVTVSGSYAQTSCFLYNVEHKLLAAEVAGFNLTASPNESTCRMRLNINLHAQKTAEKLADPDNADNGDRPR